MKIRQLFLGTLCCLASAAALAEAANTTQEKISSIQKQIQNLNQQVKQLPASQQADLQKQINQLQAQLDQVKSQQNGVSTAPTISGIPYTSDQKPDFKKMLEDLAPRGGFVTTSPYLGTASYDGSDLITNFPSINEDTMILRQRKAINDMLAKKGRTPPDRPIIDVSGYVEGKAFANDNYKDSSVKSGFDISAVELHFMAEINKWCSAYAVLSYQDSNTPYGYAASDSYVYVDRAFLTIGNLNKTPFYGTIGRVNVPFGAYDNFFISDPLTLVIAKTKEQPVVLGFDGIAGFFGSIYAFAGETYTNSSGQINNGGINLGYKYASKNFSTKLGVGIIANIADSKTALGSFNHGDYTPNGVFYDPVNRQIDHNVPALDINATFTFMEHFNIFAEYITALREFSQNDLSFNDDGALISALNLELGYNNTISDRPYTLAVGYQQSWESLGLNVPEYSFVASAAISLWRSTVEKIEYRYDINYDSDDYASGAGSFYTESLGGHKNTVQAVIDFYF